MDSNPAEEVTRSLGKRLRCEGIVNSRVKDMDSGVEGISGWFGASGSIAVLRPVVSMRRTCVVSAIVSFVFNSLPSLSAGHVWGWQREEGEEDRPKTLLLGREGVGPVMLSSRALL